MNVEGRPAGPVVAGVSRLQQSSGEGGHHRVGPPRPLPRPGSTLVEDAPDVDSRPLVLAAMPFQPAFDDVFFVAVSTAADAAGARAVRVDHVMHGGDAVRETERLIRDCSVVVADLSTNEADVLYEVGFARAQGKPVVQICAASHESLPFMVRNRETVLYEQGRTHLLADALTPYIESALRRSRGE